MLRSKLDRRGGLRHRLIQLGGEPHVRREQRLERRAVGHAHGHEGSARGVEHAGARRVLARLRRRRAILERDDEGRDVVVQRLAFGAGPEDGRCRLRTPGRGEPQPGDFQCDPPLARVSDQLVGLPDGLCRAVPGAAIAISARTLSSELSDWPRPTPRSRRAVPRGAPP